MSHYKQVTPIDIAVKSLEALGGKRREWLMPRGVKNSARLSFYNDLNCVSPSVAREVVAMSSLDRMERLIGKSTIPAPPEGEIRKRSVISRYIKHLAAEYHFDVETKVNIGVFPFSASDRKFVRGKRVAYMSATFDMARRVVVIEVPSFTRLYAKYEDLINICKHEVAHIMSWPAFDNGGHGEPFERAMRLLGAPGVPVTADDMHAATRYTIGCRMCGEIWYSNGSEEYDGCGHCGSYSTVKIRLTKDERINLRDTGSICRVK